MTKKPLTEQELADCARLAAWMKENGHDAPSLAAATGDFYTNVLIMSKGNKRVSQGFKWRFEDAFGHEEANKVFRPHLVAEPA